jgi:cytochrome c oxidase accessory protein FixG
MIGDDGSQKKIHPADVKGRFQRRKKIMWAVLIGIYMVMPWVKIGGNPAILVDIARRQFFLFGKTFNAQDFYLAFFYISGLAFTLYVVSSLFGRLWCGYACPHTVFLEGVFRRIERWIEGSAAQRERLAKAPWSVGKAARRGLKWSIYLVISALLSHTFLSYFMPVEVVFQAVVSPPSDHPSAFLFIVVFTAIIYWNFAWFREQLCIVICPYGRLQSVLYDQHTVNVGYDKARGEPRAHYKDENRGACIDCFRCVSVCPTGIDIRNGTQLECVGCANCIDACDEVMHKVGQAPGLVRYDSQAGFAGQRRRYLRPRTFLYGFLLLVGLVVFLVMASARTSFEARLHRTRSVPFTVADGVVTNIYALHLVSKFGVKKRFELVAESRPGLTVIIATPTVDLESFADRRVSVIARVPVEGYKEGQTVTVNVRVGDETQRLTARLLGPH